MEASGVPSVPEFGAAKGLVEGPALPVGPAGSPVADVGPLRVVGKGPNGLVECEDPPVRDVGENGLDEFEDPAVARIEDGTGEFEDSAVADVKGRLDKDEGPPAGANRLADPWPRALVLKCKGNVMGEWVVTIAAGGN